MPIKYQDSIIENNHKKNMKEKEENLHDTSLQESKLFTNSFRMTHNKQQTFVCSHIT